MVATAVDLRVFTDIAGTDNVRDALGSRCLAERRGLTR
jgi:hypothetical protein